MTRKKIVVSDAAPLIQLALSDHLELLPRLYDVVIPQEVFDETQYYRELPDAMEIAKAVGKWLAVKRIKNRKRVQLLLEQKLGEGEAEAIILYKEIRADSLLISDKYAASKAASLGVKTITIGDVIKEAHSAKILTGPDSIHLLNSLISQNILNTSYLRQLLEEARKWP